MIYNETARMHCLKVSNETTKERYQKFNHESCLFAAGNANSNVPRSQVDHSAAALIK